MPEDPVGTGENYSPYIRYLEMEKALSAWLKAYQGPRKLRSKRLKREENLLEACKRLNIRP